MVPGVVLHAIYGVSQTLLGIAIDQYPAGSSILLPPRSKLG